MELHASCAGRDGAGVLLLGPSGAGKSELLLRLLEQGFELVADDRVIVERGVARAVLGGEGLLEVRGVGLMRMPYLASVPVRLAVRLTRLATPRLPWPDYSGLLRIPCIDLDPSGCAAAARVRVALDCLLGRVDQIAGFLVE